MYSFKTPIDKYIKKKLAKLSKNYIHLGLRYAICPISKFHIIEFICMDETESKKFEEDQFSLTEKIIHKYPNTNFYFSDPDEFNDMSNIIYINNRYDTELSILLDIKSKTESIDDEQHTCKESTKNNISNYYINTIENIELDKLNKLFESEVIETNTCDCDSFISDDHFSKNKKQTFDYCSEEDNSTKILAF